MGAIRPGLAQGVSGQGREMPAAVRMSCLKRFLIPAAGALVVALGAAGAVRAAAGSGTAAPPIPYYPGGQVRLEVSLTQDDLLPIVHQFASRLLNPSPDEKASLLTVLADVLKDVKAACMLQMEAASLADPQQIIGFYSKYPAGRKMNRVLRQQDSKGGTLLVWSGRGGEGFYGLRLTPPVEKDTGWGIQVARLEGHVDASRLLDWPPLKRLLEQKLGGGATPSDTK